MVEDMENVVGGRRLVGKPVAIGVGVVAKQVA